MHVFSHHEFDQHELVCWHADRNTGLRALIAVHDTTLGPGIGGCRVWNYASEAAALTDVLRLSKGMTYKNALARLPLGGGKAVILGTPEIKTPELLEAFGAFVDHLNGQYITAEDVGISPADVECMRRQTDHVAGLSSTSGDPSPFTALGVLRGMEAAVEHRLNNDSLNGLSVMVQGIGHVGHHLCEMLHEAGAKLLVSDIVQARLDDAAQRWGATIIPPDKSAIVDCDIYAPCALGATVNDETLPELKCSIVAGAANNQLLRPDHAEGLRQRNILYAPDYAINAGGIINIAFEQGPNGYDKAAATKRVEDIKNTMSEIFTRAESEGRTTADVANTIAQEVLASGEVAPLF